MMKAEFKRGDVIVQIGEPFRWVVIAVEMNGQMYDVISELGFMDGDPENTNLFPTQLIERDSVKVGEWDFDSRREIDDE